MSKKIVPNQDEVLQARRKYLSLGRKPVPIIHGTKRPAEDAWQTHTFEDHDFIGRGVGVQYGSASNGEVEVDLDTEKSRRLAPYFLPETNAKFGRPRRPHSKWLYRVTDVEQPKTQKFADPTRPKDKAMIVELRGEGAQSVFPPSTHPDGGYYSWDEEGEPAEVAYEELLRRVRRLAAASLLASKWDDGVQHELALAVSGEGLKKGWEAAEMTHFLGAICDVTGNKERHDRLRAVDDTARNLAEGTPVSGRSQLIELLDHAVVRKLAEWCGWNRQVVGPINGYQPTDLGNAERLVAQHGEDIRYVQDWKMWIIWDGQRWVPDTTGELVRRSKTTVRAMYGEAANLKNDAERRALVQHAQKSESEARIRAMISLAASEPGISITSDQLDTHKWLFNVQNGTIDLLTGELLPHDREDLLTKIAPTCYDPDATSSIWERALNLWMGGDQTLVDFLQRAAGYSLAGVGSERTTLILYGQGANGKSSFLEGLRQTLGDYASRMPSETLLSKRSDGIPNDVARLKGVRFAYATEGEEGRRLNEARLKEMTGGETITARFMRGEWFDFKPEFTLWQGTNHKPLVRGTDKGIWDRIKLVPFTQSIPEGKRRPMHELLATFKAEAPGILAWAVRGCLAWQNDGLAVPEVVAGATATYRSEMDSLGDFLSEWCELSPKAVEVKGDLYLAYKNWCDEQGEFPVGSKTFTQRLEDRGLNSSRRTKDGKTERIWTGVRLREQHWGDRTPFSNIVQTYPPGPEGERAYLNDLKDRIN